MAKETRINELRDMITSAREGYNKYSDVFSKMMDMYMLRLDTKTVKALALRGKSSIYFPIINAKCKRITNALQEAYFTNKDFAKVTALDERQADKAEALQEATDFYINNKMNLFEVMQESFTYVPFMGTTVVKSYWAGDRPHIEHKNLKDVRFDPSARSWNDVRYIVEDVYLTRGDIKRLQRQGIYKRTFRADDLASNTNNHANTDKFERIKLQEIYTREGDQWKVSTLHDESTVLRVDVKLADGNPFSRGILVSQVEGAEETDAVLAYGEPSIAASQALQTEANIRRNQEIDAVKRLLEPKLIIGNNSGINPNDLSHPTRPVRASSPQDVNVLPTPQIRAADFDMQQLQQDMSENTGVSAQQNGIGAKTKMTATESSIISNEGNSRLQSYIRSFNETMIDDVMTRITRLVWKYGDARFFMGIDRQEEFEFVARVNTGLGATNKEIQMSGMGQAFQMVGGLAQMAAGVQDMETVQECVQASRNIMREMFPLLGIEDVDNYFKEKKDGQLGNFTGAASGDGVAEPHGITGMADTQQLLS